MRMKASTTGCPPLVVTGLENELVITSTDIPGSMRIPLQLNLLFVVILKRGIIKFYHALVFSVQARLSFQSLRHKKSVENLPVVRSTHLRLWLLPISVEQTTSEPTPIWKMHSLTQTSKNVHQSKHTSNASHKGCEDSHPWTSTVAKFWTEILYHQLARFQIRPERSVDKRL